MKNKSNAFILGIVLIVIAAVFNSLSVLVWKFGTMTGNPTTDFILYILGFILSGTGMIFMMLSFRFGEVSILQPMMSIGFALAIVFGFLFLGEPITIGKVIGTLFIIGGTVTLAIHHKGRSK